MSQPGIAPNATLRDGVVISSWMTCRRAASPSSRRPQSSSREAAVTPVVSRIVLGEIGQQLALHLGAVQELCTLPASGREVVA
ncbi:hypothetical protein [Amycolatopsis sp. NPDC051102]|uniref:hypothetical protein n=1 Tax=Amycolatopsis sp. NPDC051102 TaxID=3155163 RepID=UPI003434BC4D